MGARLLKPVATVPLFILQILHGNTACSHLPCLVSQRFTASAFCQARTRLPLVVWQQLLRRTAAVGKRKTRGRAWPTDCFVLHQGSATRGLVSALYPAVFTQQRSISATLQAWATHPRGVKGGSASKISLMVPRHASPRCGTSPSRHCRALARSAG